eukprot:3741815-Alexandrium_andersonii.AAC.1
MSCTTPSWRPSACSFPTSPRSVAKFSHELNNMKPDARSGLVLRGDFIIPEHLWVQGRAH